MPKGQNPKVLEPSHFLYFDPPPHFLHFRWKIKNLWQNYCLAWQVSKMVCHDPIAQKLKNYLWSLEMGLLQTRYLVEGPMEPAHLPNNTTFHAQTLKISVYFMQQIKSYSIFIFRQTHRHTFCIPMCMTRFLSIGKFMPFNTLRSFVCFTHSLCLWRISVWHTTLV